MAVIKSSRNVQSQSDGPLPVAPGKMGITSASDGRLEEFVALFEAATVFGGTLVFLGLGVEVALLISPASNEKLAGVLVNIFIALGVGIEVLCAKMASWCQGELTRRANANLAKVIRENSALQARLAPRVFSVQQVTQITAAIRPFAGSLFEIVTYVRGTEAYDFAERVDSILRNSGWERVSFDEHPFDNFMGVVASLHVVLNNEGGVQEGERLAGEALVAALRAVGIPTRALNPSKLRTHPKRVAMQVGVGEKP